MNQRTQLRLRIRRALRRRRRMRLKLCLALAVAALAPALAVAVQAQTDEAFGLEGTIDGERVAFPILKTDMQARIQGDVATVRLTQVFSNPFAAPLHARYVFPLPADAAVFAMRMQSGDRMIEAEIERKHEAKAIYEAAKQRGNQAALLDQTRPNVFVQKVANLLPGQPIRVELEYAHALKKTGVDYEFVFPMVVGPRYLPDDAPQSESGDEFAPQEQQSALQDQQPEPLEIGVWNLPASAPVASPRSVDHERVSIEIDLEAGQVIQRVESPSHALQVVATSDFARRIALDERRTLDDRDFILRYRLADESVSAGVTTQADDGQGFLSLLVEAPTPDAGTPITKREIVFVLDCSGSMSGTPMDASKRFMRRVLPRLRPSDHFRIVRFSDSANEWSEQPMPATPSNVAEGMRYVDWLQGGGGTEMRSGIRAALRPAVPDGAIRLVVFLTDGYIGNDVDIVRLISQRRGDARFFSFGVGHGVNRYLIQEMARVGRGAARIVTPTEDAGLAADELADRLESPVLTDVEIDWGDAPVRDVFPSELPDLFLGQSLRVMARYAAAGVYPIAVRGRIAGRPVTLPLEVELSENGEGGEALEILWARAQVEDRMVSYLDPALSGRQRDELKDEVTQLGLEHRLVTQWTSFVAVAKQVVNPGGFGREGDVAVPQVAGVSKHAYPPEAFEANGMQPAPTLLAGGPSFSGSSAPEPATWIALAALITVATLSLRSESTRRGPRC